MPPKIPGTIFKMKNRSPVALRKKIMKKGATHYIKSIKPVNRNFPLFYKFTTLNKGKGWFGIPDYSENLFPCTNIPVLVYSSHIK